MSGSIDLELTLQDQKLIAGLLRAAGAQKQFTGEVDKTKSASIKAEKELERLAEATKKTTATPLEKYNHQLAKLDELQKKGKISTETHARAVSMLNAETAKLSGSMQQAKTATHALGGGSTDILEIASSLGIVTTAAGAAMLAIQQVGDALKFAHQQAKEAASESKELSPSRSRLVQISGGDPKKYAEHEALAAELENTGIPRDAARDMVFSAHSEGWTSQLKQVASAHQVMGTESLTRIAGQLPGMYSEQGVKLGNLEAVNLSLKAADQSRLDSGKIAAAMVKGGEGAAPAGTSPEELAALAGVMSTRYESGDITGERIKSFGAEIAKDDRLRGKGHLGAFRTIRDEFSEEDRKKWLGEDQGKNLFYLGMQANEEKIATRKKENEEEQARFRAGGGLVRASIAITEADPTFKGLAQAQIEQNKLDRVKESKLSGHGLGVQAGAAKAERLDLEADKSSFERSMGKKVAGIAEFAGVPGSALPRVSDLGGKAFQYGSPQGLLNQVLNNFMAVANRLDQSAAKQEAAAAALEKGAKGHQHRARNVEAMEPRN